MMAICFICNFARLHKYAPTSTAGQVPTLAKLTDGQAAL